MINIDMRITLTTAQRNAWILIRPVVRTYLAKIFRIYRNATPDQRVELRLHNPILDAVLDMIGEID